MKDDDVICEIKWTVADIRTAFFNKYKREPTETELQVLIEELNTRALQNFSIEYGWDYINTAIF